MADAMDDFLPLQSIFYILVSGQLTAQLISIGILALPDNVESLAAFTLDFTQISWFSAISLSLLGLLGIYMGSSGERVAPQSDWPKRLANPKCWLDWVRRFSWTCLYPWLLVFYTKCFLNAGEIYEFCRNCKYPLGDYWLVCGLLVLMLLFQTYVAIVVTNMAIMGYAHMRETDQTIYAWKQNWETLHPISRLRHIEFDAD